jgi:simple sugar transport system permease protein
MSGVFTEAFDTTLISNGVLYAVPLMFTSVGEAISERSGVLNIGLEGMMLVGAYTGFLGAYEAHSMWLGFLTGALGGVLAAVAMVVLSVRMGLDQIVIGIAITLAGEGITSVLQQVKFGGSYPRLPAYSNVGIPGLDQIPVLGRSFFDQPVLVYLGVAFVVLVGMMFKRTSWGLELKAAGEKPEALDAAGVSVLNTRSYACLATGALAGLGGAYLAVVATGTFTPYMTQGEGYMAIVIAMLARGRPVWIALLSFGFGMSLTMTTALQLAGVTISGDVINMLPYIAIIVALLIFARSAYLPPALAVPYVRGAR